MRSRNRAFFIFLAAATAFICGFFNQEVLTFFLNKNTHIAVLSTVVILQFMYITWKSKQELRNEVYRSNDERELENLREREYRRTTFTEQLAESKAEILQAIASVKKEQDQTKELELWDRIFKGLNKVIKKL